MAKPFIYSNSNVQETLETAITHLDNIPNTEDPWYEASKEYVRGLLNLYKMFSRSSNTISGLGGLGREQAMQIATQVINGDFDKRIPITFNQDLFSAF